MRTSLVRKIALILGLSAAAFSAFWLGRDLLPLGESTLVVSPDFLDLGEVLVGQKGGGYVVVTNLGEEPARVSSVRAGGAFAPTTGELTLEPGESTTVGVDFEPTEVGATQGLLVIESDGLRGGSLEIPLEGIGQGIPAIAMEPTSLDFGDVSVGGEARGLITITNPGTAPLNVTNSLQTAPFLPEVESLTVAPGTSERMEVRFRPSRPGRQSGRLELRSDDPRRSIMYLRMAGNGVASATRAAIQVTPSSLDFGEVRVGGSTRQLLEIRNTGDQTLQIVNMTLPSDEFRGSGRSRRIEPGGKLSLPISFSPRSEGPRFAPLVIYSNDPNAGVLPVALLGTGSHTATVGSETSSTAAGGSVFLGGGGAGQQVATGADGFDAPGEADVPFEVADTPSDPDTPPDTGAATPSFEVGDESEISLLGHNVTPIFEFDLDISYDPESGRLELNGYLPPVDLPLGRTYSFPDQVSGRGYVDEAGDVESFGFPIRLADPTGGEPIEIVLQLTTNRLQAPDEMGTLRETSGVPFDPQTGGTLVGLAQIPGGGLGRGLIGARINVRPKQ